MNKANKEKGVHHAQCNEIVCRAEDFAGNSLGWIASAPETPIAGSIHATLGDVGETILKIIDDCVRDIVINKKEYVTTEGAFSMRRKLTMEIMLYLIITMGRKGLQDELGEFFEHAPDAPTKGAYVRALDRLKPDTCERLFHEINRRIAAAGLASKTYLKFRVCAIDSSSINVAPNPEETKTKVKGQGNQTSAHALFDIANGYFLDVIVESKNILGERDAAEIMLSRHPELRQNSLITEDRGYISLNHIAFLLNGRYPCCTRSKDMLSEKSWLKAYEPYFAQYMENGEFDVVLTIRVFSDSKAESEEDGVWAKNPKYKLCKEFRYCGKNGYFEMSIRIIRIILPSGTPEILVTNISPTILSKEDAKRVYHLRWNEEGEFLHLKYSCEAIYLHHTTASRYTNELYGRFIMANFTSLCVANSISVEDIGRRRPKSYVAKKAKKDFENYIDEMQSFVSAEDTHTEKCFAYDSKCLSYNGLDGNNSSDENIYVGSSGFCNDVHFEYNEFADSQGIVCTNSPEFISTTNTTTNISMFFKLNYTSKNSQTLTSESIIIPKNADLYYILNRTECNDVRIYKINYNVLCEAIYEEAKNLGRRFRRQKPSTGIRDTLTYAARFRTLVGRIRPSEQIPPRGNSHITYFPSFAHRGR